MKKEAKEMLKTIISNQYLIMKALNIEIPGEKPKKEPVKKSPSKKVIQNKKARTK